MRGKVIAYDDMDGRGIISGDDGQRYNFVRGSIGSKQMRVRPGQDVDFQTAGSDAQSVYVIGQGNTYPGRKSKIAAGLLALFLGGLGIHKFYLGMAGAGAIMLILWLLGLVIAGIPALIISIVAIVEGIIYLTTSDEDFYQTYEINKKSWF